MCSLIKGSPKLGVIVNQNAALLGGTLQVVREDFCETSKPNKEVIAITRIYGIEFSTNPLLLSTKATLHVSFSCNMATIFNYSQKVSLTLTMTIVQEFVSLKYTLALKFIISYSTTFHFLEVGAVELCLIFFECVS